MQEKPLTVAAYAAGAALSAATLVYVFGPTYFFDDEMANSSRSSRKKGVVGLSNPANDCFINSVLQALAGLPELRLYLIREMHRRKLDGTALYEDLSAAVAEQERKDGKPTPEWKLLSLQRGQITAGLKEVLDALNERPIYKKTISAQGFIRVVEEAFKTRVSRYQQDAQEFLQIVTERLADEHHAGRKVRRGARRKRVFGAANGGQLDAKLSQTAEGLERSEETIRPTKRAAEAPVTGDSAPALNIEASSDQNSERIDSGTEIVDEDRDDIETPAFPLEGKTESQIECSHCHFKPKPSESSFVTMTLNVPHDSNSTSLNACFDGMLKVEHIDDFRCERCRLDHAWQIFNCQLASTITSDKERTKLENNRRLIERALENDPEDLPKDIELPDIKSAPKRKIARHMRISSFPRVLAIHLNRSVWDRGATSSKNMAKVSFPETLPLGGLLDRKTYRLLSVVTHKGGHNSGHYETFRRQWLNPPYSTPANMGREGIFSLQPTPTPSPYLSAAPSPRFGPRTSKDAPPPTTLDGASDTSGSSHSLHRLSLDRRRMPISVPLDAIPTPGLPTPPTERIQSNDSQAQPRRNQSVVDRAREGLTRKRKPQDRWWRISDDKIKESKTSDVLGMQKEVYLLFYEMIDN